MAKAAQVVHGMVINVVEIDDNTDKSVFSGDLIATGADVAIGYAYDATTGEFFPVDLSVNLTPEEAAALYAPIPLAIVEE